MSFIQDILPITKKRDLLFLESHRETEDIYSFVFEKEKDFNWKAGQHGLFSIIHKKIKKPKRMFSVSSSPKENVIRITTRIDDDPSDFMKALLELKQRMKIRMSGPVGGFYLKDNNPTLLIAGGIGITPFRSMLKQLEIEGNRDNKQIKLLYIDSGHSHLFKDDLESIAKTSLVHITYLHSKDDLYEETAKFISSHNDNGTYFISGSKSLVDSMSTYLLKKNISKQNIKKDTFIGI